MHTYNFTTINGSQLVPGSAWGVSQDCTRVFYKRQTREPFVFEAEHRVDGSMDPRIELLNTAKRVPGLFSLSIVPVNPKMRQTWYMRKSPPNPAVELTSKRFFSDYPPTVNIPPIRHVDFVKPFPHYQCDDQLPGHQPYGQLNKADELENVPSPLHGVIDRFRRDAEAKELVVNYIHGGRLEQLRFVKTQKVSQ